MNDRLKQLRAALRELEGNNVESLSGSLTRALRLLELCPWIQDPAPRAAPSAKPSQNGKRLRGRKKPVNIQEIRP